MRDEIYLCELDCFKNASDSEKKNKNAGKGRKFSLKNIQNPQLKTELIEFIEHRGKVLTLSSICSDIYPFNVLCEFISEEYASLDSFSGIDLEKMVREYLVWLGKHGKSIRHTKTRKITGRTEIVEPDTLKYFRKIYDYFNKNKTFLFENDIWFIDQLPFEVKNNPTNKTRQLNFSKIEQKKIKEEIKGIFYEQLHRMSASMVALELSTLNKLSKFLAERFSKVSSIINLSREIIEEFLIHLNLEDKSITSSESDLKRLRVFMNDASFILSEPSLQLLILPDDIPKRPRMLVKTYSDSEAVRFNECVYKLFPQLARVIFLHELLGTRISETLTLKQNAIRKSPTGEWVISIFQGKNSKWYEKTIDKDIKAIFDEACKFTREKYGTTDYVFVRDKNPTEPMQYTMLMNQLKVMVQNYNLKDDHGNLFRIGTHIFRHTYGARLAELGYSDEIIAKLLGHSNTRSVPRYRAISNTVLLESTDKYIADLNDKIKNINVLG